jgi:hypothetical protein
MISRTPTDNEIALILVNSPNSFPRGLLTVFSDLPSSRCYFKRARASLAAGSRTLSSFSSD